MPQICHAHCPKGGGGGALAALIAFIVIIAVIAKPAAAAARDAERLAVEVVEYLAIGIGAAAVLGGTAVAAVAVHSARQRHTQQAIQTTSEHARVIAGTVLPEAAQTLSAPQRAAIEAPRASLADLKSLAAEHGYDVVRRDA